MTYSTDIAGRTNRVGYYVAFDGIAARLATHEMVAAAGLTGTYHPVIEQGSLQGSGSSLDRAGSLVLPGGFSFRVLDTDAARTFVRRRGGTETALSLSITSAGTELALASGTNTYANGSVIHVDREAITLGTHDGGGTYITCVRAANGSVARHHAADAVVSDVPRHWLGRRAQLYAVNLDTGTEKAIRTAIVSRSPRFVDGAWEFDLIDLTRELRRPLNSGWFPERVISVARSGRDAIFTVGDAKAFADSGSSHVKITHGDGVIIANLGHAGCSIDTGANTVTIDPEAIITAEGVRHINGTGWIDDLDASDVDIDMQQVILLRQDPALAALIFMLSIEGDETNSSYDLLAGRLPTGADTHAPRTGGAGIPLAWVDTASFADLAGVGGSATFYLDEPISLLEWLVTEVAWRLGGYIRINASGQIAFERWRVSVPSASTETLDASDVAYAGIDTVDDESEVLSQAVFECNYNPATGTYGRTVTVSWRDTVNTYGEELQSLELSSRTMWVGQASPSRLVSQPYGNETQIVWAFDRQYSRTHDGLRKVRLRLPWSRHEDFAPGHLFKLTLDFLPDHEGGEGITARQYEVTSSSPDYEQGIVEIEGEEMPPGWLVAPSAVVSSIKSATITIDTTGDEADLFDSEPSFDFITDCDVRVYDMSASPPGSVSEVQTVVSRGTSTTMQLDAAPSSFTVAAGDVIVLENSANTGNTNAGDADVQDHLFMVDSDDLIDAGGATEREGSRLA